MLKFAAKTAAAFALVTFASTASATPIQMQDTDIRDFVRWYVDQSGSPLAIHPTATGTLTVYAPDVPDHQLDEFFQGVFEFPRLHHSPRQSADRCAGHSISSKNTRFLFQPKEPHDPAAAIANAPTLTPPPEPQATHLFSFNNVRADDIAPLVTTFLAQNAQDGSSLPRVQVLHASNAILAKGPEKQLSQLQELLPQVTSPTLNSSSRRSSLKPPTGIPSISASRSVAQRVAVSPVASTPPTSAPL
ncbi:hypothetical protein [Halomonas sp. PA16-9]|uniref:hypothetical protein n=1 Tax=Halomonas sp. PA16-9 TaxID=2576841 RepID=UPI0030EBA7A5